MWGWRLPSALFFMPNFENFATEERKNNPLEQRNIVWKIEILKAMIKDNFEEQRKLIAAGNGSGSSNQFQWQTDAGQPGHARLMLKVCDRTLIRWRTPASLYFKLSGQDLLLGLGRTQIPERRMPKRRFYIRFY